MVGIAMSWMTMMGGLSYARSGEDAFVLRTQRDTRTMYFLINDCMHEHSMPPASVLCSPILAWLLAWQSPFERQAKWTWKKVSRV